jgi:hypothetical protein
MTDGYFKLPRRDFSDASTLDYSGSTAIRDQPAARNDRTRNITPSSPAAPSDSNRLDESDLADELDFGQGPALGLGISAPENELNAGRRISIPRVPVGMGSTRSPPLGNRSHAHYNRRASGGVSFSPEVRDSPTQSRADIRPPPFEIPYDNSTGSTPGLAGQFKNENPSKSYQRSLYGQGKFRMERNHSNRANPKIDGAGCPSHKNIFERRADWLSTTILMLAIFSTFFSGFYLVLAIAAPRYGSRIRSSGGGMKPSTASTLSTLFAKLIELSFVTVFVSFLGQVLSRRAFIRRGKGINLAELSMRSWSVFCSFCLFPTDRILGSCNRVL